MLVLLYIHINRTNIPHLCDKLITRPEESYRLWRVVVCDLETTKILVNEE